MNRTVKRIRREELKDAPTEQNSVKMSGSEKLELLSEIERIANSQHTALMQKIRRLREAIASDN